tara:strand:- start:264 stop:434 length:171 start_codon:yes stop_codon:yes gene_type:complete
VVKGVAVEVNVLVGLFRMGDSIADGGEMVVLLGNMDVVVVGVFVGVLVESFECMVV